MLLKRTGIFGKKVKIVLDIHAHFKKKMAFIGRKDNKVFCPFVSLFCFKILIVNPFHWYSTLIRFRLGLSTLISFSFFLVCRSAPGELCSPAYILYYIFKYAPHTIPSMSSCSLHQALQIDPKTWWREAFFFFLLLKKKNPSCYL